MRSIITVPSPGSDRWHPLLEMCSQLTGEGRSGISQTSRRWSSSAEPSREAGDATRDDSHRPGVTAADGADAKAALQYR